MKRVVLGVVAAFGVAGVGAQVRCTMPSGVVIEQALAKQCPRDAIRGETLDGKPLAPKVEPQKPMQRRGSGNQVEIGRAQLGGAWPLTVDSGVLRCEPLVVGDRVNPLVTFESGGRIYAINGTASSWASRKGWQRVNDIWRDDPTVPGAKLPVSSLIAKGLELCGMK